MTALDVITLQQAKDYLKVDFPDDDDTITGIIETAIDMVEKHTSYMLYNRDLTRHVRNGHEIYEYPASVVSLGVDYTPVETPFVNEFDSTFEFGSDITVEPITEETITTGAIHYSLRRYTLFTKLVFSNYIEELLVLNVGYTNRADIPATLLSACFKLIVYLYEHRDIQKAELPADVYMMLQPYRRYASI